MLIDEATVGPVPTAAEVEAAMAVRPEGRPAIVGVMPTPAVPPATTSSDVPGSTPLTS
jgi:hypothetical protein